MGPENLTKFHHGPCVRHLQRRQRGDFSSGTACGRHMSSTCGPRRTMSSAPTADDVVSLRALHKVVCRLPCLLSLTLSNFRLPGSGNFNLRNKIVKRLNNKNAFQ